jgi:2-deoxy-D-gluconate 3-dehydrogenase
MFDLTGKVAIVTGGNGGIGFGMARGLANAGARVVVAALNQEKCRTAAQALRDLGFESLALPVDVADERSVDTLVEQTIHHCGQLDILINNAGVNVRKPPQEISLTNGNT